MPTNITDLSLDQLKRAVQIKEQIEKLQHELASTFGSSGYSQKPATSPGMSEATKAKLRAAAKARWDQVKAGKRSSAPVAKSITTTGRKPMSVAARARLSALMKAKWAAKNKGGNKPAAKKKTMSAAAKARLSAMAKARWAKVKAAGKKSL
jgi:hypothetical protein